MASHTRFLTLPQGAYNNSAQAGARANLFQSNLDSAALNRQLTQHRLNTPPSRSTAKDAAGYLRYLDAGKERVFPDVVKPIADLTSAQIRDNAEIDQARRTLADKGLTREDILRLSREAGHRPVGAAVNALGVATGRAPLVVRFVCR